MEKLFSRLDALYPGRLLVEALFVAVLFAFGAAHFVFGNLTGNVQSPAELAVLAYLAVLYVSQWRIAQLSAAILPVNKPFWEVEAIGSSWAMAAIALGVICMSYLLLQLCHAVDMPYLVLMVIAIVVSTLVLLLVLNFCHMFEDPYSTPTMYLVRWVGRYFVPILLLLASADAVAVGLWLGFVYLTIRLAPLTAELCDPPGSTLGVGDGFF